MLKTLDTQKQQPFILLKIIEPKQGTAKEQGALPTIRERKGFFFAWPWSPRAQAPNIICSKYWPKQVTSGERQHYSKSLSPFKISAPAGNLILEVGHVVGRA